MPRTSLLPMTTAPRDGTLVRLWLRQDGSDFVGYYSDKWWGWVDYDDPWPLIRGDIWFTGWEAIDQAAFRRERLVERVSRGPRRRRLSRSFRSRRPSCGRRGLSAAAS